MPDNKRIAKNTIFLYIRMILVMGVSLYTSRVILDKLGVDDYALYNVVGGIVGMLSFINGTLSIGTSRFLTYELGRGEGNRLTSTFITAFYSHLALAIMIVVILETVGLWFIYNKLVVPGNRLNSCFWVYQISIITSFINITQVPYTSAVMAHEKMGIYAYVSIIETISKLAICYLVTITTSDKLILYALLLGIVTLIVALCYRFYCHRNFYECHLSLEFDRNIFKGLMSFSGWNLLANLSETLKLEGYIIILNMFFSPVVVAAQSIGNQVTGAMMQFVNNFRLALNPQIIKLYASGDYESSKYLTISSTVLIYDLVLMLGLPTIVSLGPIMSMWLVDVPDYAIVFTQFIIAQRVLSTFDTAFYIPLMASAKVKSNSLVAILMGPGTFIILYIIFKLGGDVMWIQYIGLIVIFLMGFVIKPFLVIKEVQGYVFADFYSCFKSCIQTTLLSIAVAYCITSLYPPEDVKTGAVCFFVTLIGVFVSSFIFLEKQLKSKIIRRITISLKL